MGWVATTSRIGIIGPGEVGFALTDVEEAADWARQADDRAVQVTVTRMEWVD